MRKSFSQTVSPSLLVVPNCENILYEKKKGPCHPVTCCGGRGKGRESNLGGTRAALLPLALATAATLPPWVGSGREGEGGEGRGGEHRHHRSLRAASTAACGGCCRRHPPTAAPAESGREGGYYGRGTSPSSLPFSNQISPQLLTPLELKYQRVANRT